MLAQDPESQCLIAFRPVFRLPPPLIRWPPEEAEWKDLFKRKILALRTAGRFPLKCVQKIAIQGDVSVGRNCRYADIQRGMLNFDLAGGIAEEFP